MATKMPSMTVRRVSHIRLKLSRKPVDQRPAGSPEATVVLGSVGLSAAEPSAGRICGRVSDYGVQPLPCDFIELGVPSASTGKLYVTLLVAVSMMMIEFLGQAGSGGTVYLMWVLFVVRLNPSMTVLVLVLIWTVSLGSPVTSPSSGVLFHQPM